MINNLSIQMIENKLAKHLVSGCIDFSVIENIIKNPLSKKKEDLPLWFFCSLIDENNHKRTLDNFKDMYAFILDFDDNLSIRDFKDKFSKYYYYLYTTSSHSKDLDKFRVIMPLKTPTRYNKIRNNEFLEAIVNFFEGVDRSSFRNYHNLPNLPKDPSDYYYYFNKTDNFFDIDILNDEIKRISRRNEIERMKNATRGIGKNYSSEMSENSRIAYKNKVESKFLNDILEIPSHTTNHRYTDLCEFVGKMLSAKFPDGDFIFDKHEIENLVFLNCKDNRVKIMINTFYNKRGN